MVHICLKLNPLPARSFVPSLVVHGSVVLEKNNSKSRQWIFALSLLSSLWKRLWPFIWTNLKHLNSPKDALCQIWLKLAKWFWRRRRNWEKLIRWVTATSSFGSGELKYYDYKKNSSNARALRSFILNWLLLWLTC